MDFQKTEWDIDQGITHSILSWIWIKGSKRDKRAIGPWHWYVLD